MSSCISAVGIANPKNRIAQSAILGFMRKAFRLNENDANRLKSIYDHCGINQRYSVIPDFGFDDFAENEFFPANEDLEPFPDTKKRMGFYRKQAIEVAAQAAQNCLSAFDASFTGKISHLITVSCTGMYAPGIDIDLIEKLGLNRNTERICINFMGCYGSVNALKTADHICQANPEAKVLVVSVELCTLHFQKENTLENWVANSLFSDGAAAAIIENTDKRSINKPHLILKNFYAEYIYEARNEMNWLISNSGFEMKLTSQVSKQIQKHIKPLAEKALQKAGLLLQEIDLFAIHPGGKKILEAAENGLGICKCKNSFAHEVLAEYGNMSSATILFVLQKILAEKTDQLAQNILSFAFGPGLTVESMVLQKQSV
ncbi:MAG: type III polyketide synthase [Mucilaginibacter sp.]|uniref:type III polyketide synthase n=1 Tax=Mucilaginibacter sp. TaxID=1882438 RepID=UPI0034E5A5DE